MSTQSIETVLYRAMSDSDFADSLFANPEKVLAGFDLTAAEAANFQGLSRAEFEALTSRPEERKSFIISVCRNTGGNHNETALTIRK